MSRFEGPQGIVTNVLVLNLDAGDPDSYTLSQPPYVEVLVVTGGGGGGQDGAGGGGAGGLIYNSAYQLTSAAAVTVTVGGGGAGSATVGGQASDGGNSVFGALTAIVGGGGGSKTANGRSGGSGGGAGHNAAGASSNIGGDGTAGQGFRGGDNIAQSGGGGGGAGQPGFYGSNPVPGNGGNGLAFTISGTSTYYAGGGGGGGYVSPVTSSGGLGGGGNGGGYLSNGAPSAVGQNGTANTGGGGGSNGNAGNSTVTGTGGSGIVIVRYPGLPAATGGTITYLNGYTIHTFTSSGTFTPYLWNDLSGNGNNSTLINGPAFASNENGGVLDFDGTDDYSTVPSNAAWAIGQNGTLEMWVKREGSVTSNHRLWCVTNNSSNLDAYLDAATGGFYMHGGVIGTNSVIPLNEWLSILVTYSGGTISIYYNGVVQPLTGTSTGYNITGTGTLFIAQFSGGGGYYWNGKIANFKIYNIALSQAEINQNFNAEKNTFGVGLPSNGLIVNLDASNVASYPGTGTTWYDLSGTGNNATLVNGVAFSSANGGIFDFDGLNDYAYIADNATLDLAGDKSQGIWLYMDQSYNGTGMLGKADNSVNGMALSYGWAGGFENIAWNSANSPSLASSGADINNWYYVAGVQSGGTRYIYVIGANGFRVSSYSGGNHTWNNALNFTIGQVAGYYTNMKAGAVHVYNRALSASEISAIYATQKSRFGLS